MCIRDRDIKIGMSHSEAELFMKISTDFTTKAMKKCSMACIKELRSGEPSSTEKVCMDACMEKHTKLFSEGMKFIQGQEQGQAKGKQRSNLQSCLLYTSPSPRDATLSRMPSSA
eukprot:TRINITY_DN4213_c0_g1_i1.p1 TRINITY_DN4213_c0_g1~~TRINITY_DN4213_c0_g1_i1.p1  ORF type:complete len:121 (-),score=29.92 TRINITY_DN4213_c0_g1_i1:11-352(-)